MAQGDITFNLVLNQDSTLKIELGTYERMHITSKLAEFFNKYNQMGKWFDDPSVPNEQKEPYMPMLQNMMQTMNMVYQILKLAGVSDKEMTEQLGIPF